MNIELQKQRNDLLYRTNVIATITNVKTPTRQEILKKVAAMLGCDKRLIVIDKIDQEFGVHNSLAYIKIYDDLKHLKEIELDYKVKRTGEIVDEETVDKKEEIKSKAKSK